MSHLQILARALIVSFKILAGHNARVDDVTRIAAFEIRCTKDVLIVQSEVPQPTPEEVHNAAAVFAHVGYQVIIGTDQRPYVSVAAVKNEDCICDVRISLGTEENPE